MKKHKKIKYTDKSIGSIKIMKDFLAAPAELALREETVKVTLSLTKDKNPTRLPLKKGGV